MSFSTLLNNLARPEDIRRLRTGIPGYEQNRERAAVVVQKGFLTHDRYQKARPFIFAASLASAVASGALWYRRRRHAEAHMVYPAMFALSAATAYLTRPREDAPCPPPGEPAEAGDSAFLVYLDKEVAKAKAKDPRFADKVFQRLSRTCAVRSTWEGSPDYVKAMVV